MMRQLSGMLALSSGAGDDAQAPAWANDCRLRLRRCVTAAADCGCGCGCGTVIRTIYVPECTTEMRTVTRVRYHQEQREKTITVYKRVPITEEKTAPTR